MRVFLITLALLLALPASAGAVELRSGPLTATVKSEPFALEFRDAADGDVLRTLSGAGGERGKYGSLGYSFDLRVPVVNNAFFGYEIQAEGETVWFARDEAPQRPQRGARHARARPGHERPAGPPARGGAAAGGGRRDHHRVADRAGVRAARGPRVPLRRVVRGGAGGERYLGFGSRSNAVDQTGNRVFSWAEEGPFGAGEYDDEVRTLVPGFTFPTGPTTTNFPIPWMVSTRGLGFLIDQTERSTFDLLNERGDAWHAQAEAQRFAFTVFAGPRPADVVRRYSSYAGRQPNPRRWFFGPWVQFKDPWPERFRALDVPTTVAQTYTHYLPCGIHRGFEQRERRNTARHHGLGYKITTYFNPHICTTYRPVYDDAARRGLLVKNPQGDPYLLTNPFTADQIVSEVDFTHPGGRDLFGRLLDEAIRDGYDGWMEDFGEYTPTDSVFHNGKRGLEMHNRYPVLYHGTSTAHTTRRGGDFAVFIRSGFHGVQPHARLVWGGDPNEDWSCTDGLCAALHQAVNTGLSGIAYQGSDIGGFHSITGSAHQRRAERALAPARGGERRDAHAGQRLQLPQRPRPPLAGVEPRRAAHLAPLREAAHAAVPVHLRRLAHLPAHRAADRAAPRPHPPHRPGRRAPSASSCSGPTCWRPRWWSAARRTRSLRLPRGRWIDLWRSASYDGRLGGLRLNRQSALAGGRTVKLPAPLDELPLLVKSGALLGLLPPDTDTLAEEGRQKGLVHLRERRYRLHVLAFPRGISRADLGTGVRALSVERRGRWSLRLRAARKKHAFRLQASLANLRRPFRPCSVRLRGRRLKRRLWSYDRRTRVFRAHFKVKRGTLVVRRCAPRRRG